jgi:hypothetical protein
VDLREEVKIAVLEELKPVIVAAEELPEIVPGLAVPESPALPEDDAIVEDAAEEVARDSVVESAETVVATPVDTIATPE